MPRQTRRPPVDITRFNYWDRETCQPREAALLQLRHQFPSAAQIAEDFVVERFVHHLDSPCGERLCRIDRKLKDHPERRVELALRDYIENSREWHRNPVAQRALKALPLTKQKALKAFATKQYDIGRRRWDTLIDAVCEDISHFLRMLPAGLASVVTPADGTYSAMRKIWHAYATQTLALVGRGPTMLAISLGVAEPATGGRRRVRLDLRGLSAEEQAYVVHWFCHAARNLIRDKHGDAALPFEHPVCAAACHNAIMRVRLTRHRAGSRRPTLSSQTTR